MNVRWTIAALALTLAPLATLALPLGIPTGRHLSPVTILSTFTHPTGWTILIVATWLLGLATALAGFVRRTPLARVGAVVQSAGWALIALGRPQPTLLWDGVTSDGRPTGGMESTTLGPGLMILGAVVAAWLMLARWAPPAKNPE